MIVIFRLGDCVVITLKYKFVILNPSQCVTLSEAKGLGLLRVNSVKNLIRSMCCKTRFFGLGLRMTIVTQPPSQGMTDNP